MTGLSMTNDNSIFGIRTGSRKYLYPTLRELRHFLESPKTPGGQELHSNDLARYQDLLDSVTEFERRKLRSSSWQNVRETIFFRVLSHSQFANAALKLEVVQYKYYLHAFMSLDFKEPLSLIASGEAGMSRLDPKIKTDAVIFDQLRGMIKDQQNKLEAMRKQGIALEKELEHIALYIRDNLMKIAKRCETAIVILAELQVRQNKEALLIEEIKGDFKERLRTALRNGPVTRAHLVLVKRAVSNITRKLPVLIREDLYSMSGLYEAIYAHGLTISREIDAHMAGSGSSKGGNSEEDRERFVQVGRVLVSLVSDFQPTEIQNPTSHANILLGKRHKMIDSVFELLQKERRARKNRRSGMERRTSHDPSYKEPDRRHLKSRRERPTRKDWLAA
jgi:hypothetical protein